MASLNHIGIAVSDLPRLQKLFSILGLSVDHDEEVPEQGVRVHFLPLPKEKTQIEFLVPKDPNGAIAKFLKKRGPGIHHLSFEVKKGELEKICEKLKLEGFQLIYDSPQKGAHQMRINFVHPASAGGILLEIMEPT